MKSYFCRLRAEGVDADENCRLVKGQVFLWPGATDWRALWDENGVITQ